MMIGIFHLTRMPLNTRDDNLGIEFKFINKHFRFDRIRQGNAGKDIPQGIPEKDIALVKLQRNASFNDDYVSPVCLPKQVIV